MAKRKISGEEKLAVVKLYLEGMEKHKLYLQAA